MESQESREKEKKTMTCKDCVYFMQYYNKLFCAYDDGKTLGTVKDCNVTACHNFIEKGCI